MQNCHSCGFRNEEDKDICIQCGTVLVHQPTRGDRSGDGAKRNKIRKTKLPFFMLIVVILVIGAFTTYQILSKKFSREAVIEQFKGALAKRDKAMLKELIIPGDTRLKVNNQSLDALFTLIDREPSIMQEIENSLLDEGLGNHLFFLREEGNQFGLFHRYVIDTPSYFISINHTGEETAVYVNESEIGILDGSEETKEFGPFLAGSYTVKGIQKTGKKSKKTYTVKLAGTKTTEKITLFSQPPKKEKPDVKEKTVVKEIIRE
ncbi:TcaA second domain-containing protein, partial [Bacillus xiapuensis]|nr:hypothetical protein [Bacillus xiapuensis]